MTLKFLTWAPEQLVELFTDTRNTRKKGTLGGENIEFSLEYVESTKTKIKKEISVGDWIYGSGSQDRGLGFYIDLYHRVVDAMDLIRSPMIKETNIQKVKYKDL